MSPKREWQLYLCKEMLRTLKSIFSLQFIKSTKSDPLLCVGLIVLTILFDLADLVRMSFDPDYPPMPEWKSVNDKITMLN